MKKNVMMIVSAAFMTIAAIATAGEALDFRRPEIVPEPLELSYEPSVPVRIDAAVKFVVTCPDAAEAAKWVETKVESWFGVRPAAVEAVSGGGFGGGDEGYSLKATPGEIAIGAKTLRGVKYAMHTLRQAAERESAGVKLKGYWLPALQVRDEPALQFRGIHFCWFPECTAGFIEHQIRVAAYYKFNYAVIENWGVFKSDRYPFLSVPDAPLTVKEAKRLAAVARDLGLTLVPQVNVFGHAAMLRSMSGKHATLDTRPEYQPLFEPANGWNWCLSNPDAKKVLHGLVEEMHEAFGNPPFFHIGCDEADVPTCPRCRAVKPYAKLVGAHLAEVAALLRKRGARAMMWHDMLLEKGKWKPFYANGSAEEAKMLDTLPKDVVICDWYYGSDSSGRDASGGRMEVSGFPTLEHFKLKGFDVLTCPWRNDKGIEMQTRYAREHGMFGVLETVWHHYRGHEFARMVGSAACGAWGHGRTALGPGRGQGGPRFATFWRQCGWDMGIKDYAETGFYDRQVTRDALDR
jgi:hypothetical protein